MLSLRGAAFECPLGWAELPDISSSAAREALARGDRARAAALLHPAVLAWCEEHGPWRAGTARRRGTAPCVKSTCSSTNRVMYTPLLGLWESGRGGRVSSTTRSDAARPRRRGQPTYRAGRQSSALEQEDVIAVLGLPSSRPGGPGLGR